MFNIIFFHGFFLLKCHFNKSILRNFLRGNSSQLETEFNNLKQLAQ
jgi:hypothetical protein